MNCDTAIYSEILLSKSRVGYEYLGKTINNTLYFSLYWLFVFFVFLTELMIVWPNYS